jgi:hypothetical protein
MERQIDSTTTTKSFSPKQIWGRLEMKPHNPKNRDKARAKKKGENKGDKKMNRKMRKGNRTLSQKSKNGRKKNFDKKAMKEKESKILKFSHTNC